MVTCPNCSKKTISRWRAKTECSNCGAVIQDSHIYRAVCGPLSVIGAAFLMGRWYPHVGGIQFAMVLLAAGGAGAIVNYAFPRFKILCVPTAKSPQSSDN